MHYFSRRTNRPRSSDGYDLDSLAIRAGPKRLAKHGLFSIVNLSVRVESTSTEQCFVFCEWYRPTILARRSALQQRLINHFLPPIFSFDAIVRNFQTLFTGINILLLLQIARLSLLQEWIFPNRQIDIFYRLFLNSTPILNFLQFLYFLNHLGSILEDLRRNVSNGEHSNILIGIYYECVTCVIWNIFKLREHYSKRSEKYLYMIMSTSLNIQWDHL